MILNHIRLLYIFCILISAPLIGMESKMEIFETNLAQDYFDPNINIYLPSQYSLGTSLEQRINNLEKQISSLQERVYLRQLGLERLATKSQLSDAEEKEQQRLIRTKNKLETTISKLQERLAVLKAHAQEKSFEQEMLKE